MQLKRILPFILALVLTNATVANTDHSDHKEEAKPEAHADAPMSAEQKKKADVDAFIKHHVKDSHSFNIFSSDSNDFHVGFPLPVILIDEGLHVFMSSAFHHGESVAESNGKHYALFHGKIYRVDGPNGTVTMDEHHHATNVAPLDLSITKNVFSIILVMLLVAFLFIRMAGTYKTSLVPKKGGKFLEPLIIFVRDEIAIPNIGEKSYGKYMPYLLTVFFFIWITNLVGMTPLGINVTGNLAVTAALAGMTFLITQFTSKKDYWMHIFWMPGVPVPMKIILAPIELVGVIIKPFALMIRLYANILAGHIVMMTLISLFLAAGWIGSAYLGLTFFISLIEILVAFLQAYIFTMLTALFFGAASEEHAHEGAH